MGKENIESSPILTRLAMTDKRLSELCARVATLVGAPEGAKCAEASETANVLDRVEDLLDSVEYRTAELESQMERLVRRLGD